MKLKFSEMNHQKKIALWLTSSIRSRKKSTCVTPSELSWIKKISSTSRRSLIEITIKKLWRFFKSSKDSLEVKEVRRILWTKSEKSKFLLWSKTFRAQLNQDPENPSSIVIICYHDAAWLRNWLRKPYSVHFAVNYPASAVKQC